jgi:hypothetical protein
MIFSILALNTAKYAGCHYSERHLCRVSFMLSVAHKIVTLSAVILRIVILNVVAPQKWLRA